MTSHVASNMTHRGGGAVDAPTIGHFGYRTGQVVRRRVKGHFGRPSTDGLKRADQHFKSANGNGIAHMARILDGATLGAAQ
ncbi:hypothetical protein ABL850_31630 [Variovorax paradoxus]|jgi:L-serine deaminase|uniref:hypothetical protein n=1 Tax=Variovorax paradoxus TaxID=34073 RepID=UPI00042A2E82